MTAPGHLNTAHELLHEASTRYAFRGTQVMGLGAARLKRETFSKLVAPFQALWRVGRNLALDATSNCDHEPTLGLMAES